MATLSYLPKYSRKYATLALAVSLCVIGVSSPEGLFGLARSESISANVGSQPNSSALDPLSNVNQSSTSLGEKSSDQVVEIFNRLPIRFEANRGQTDPRVKFIARGGGGRFFLTSDESVFVLQRSNPKELNRDHHARRRMRRGKADVIRMRLIGGNEQPEVVGESELPGKSNFFIGNEKEKWVTDVPTYSQVRYKDVLSGIDMIYHGNNRQLEYDFEIAPGADPSLIRLGFTGILKVKVTRDGDLSLLTRGGEILQRRPHAFQEIDGQKVNVPCNYVVRGRQVRFQLGDYDRTKRLIIDPVLIFSSYLGGNGEDRAYDITLDDSRNVYITGKTVSTDFPMDNAYEGWNGGMCMSGTYPCYDVFVTKMRNDGQALLFSTYVGGTGEETGQGITLDSSNNVYVVGQTSSGNFPALGDGPYKKAKTNSAYIDAFMFKLTSAGNSIPYGTYINGSGSATGSLNSTAYAVALDFNNKVWIAGTTASLDFPTTSGALKPTYCKFGGDNGFLLKIDPNPDCDDTRTPPCPVASNTPTDPTDLLYGTYVCGSGGNSVMDMALDPFGNVWLAGEAKSGFPTTLDAFQPGISDPSDINERDGYAAKIDFTGTIMLYATYIGGTSIDKAWGVATDGDGNAYVAGTTSSSNFPTTPGAFDTTLTTLDDIFVTKFLGTGLAAYSTFLGGNNIDNGFAIAADDAGHAYVTGTTAASNFPVTPNAYQSTSASGPRDAFLTKLTPDGSALDYSTYLGGSGQDYAEAIALDSAGNAYLAGHTASSNFPTTTNAHDTTFGGGTFAFDAFVSKLSTETFVISGRVTDSANLGFNGVTVTLTGSRSATTLTDVGGNYSFEVPSNGNYTVTPSRSGFTFTPTSTNLNSLNEDRAAYFSTASAQPVSPTRPQPLLADAAVQDMGASSSTNYGKASELTTQVKTTVGMNRESYLKFDVSNFDSATTVKLRLFGRLSTAASSNIPASVFSVATTTWDEKTITWNNKPASGPTALATTTVTDTVARWYEWDVTSYVNAERVAGRTIVSFVLKNDPAGSISVTRFNSREAGDNKPRLEVTSPTVTTTLPSPWVSQDVGTGMTAGSGQYLSGTGTFTVLGAGTGITDSSTSDAFQFVHQQISGDFRVVARVSGVQAIGPLPRAGLTIRASLAVDAAHASILVMPPANTAEFLGRTTAGAGNGAPVTKTKELWEGWQWIMLTRRGTELRGYISLDGVNWNELGDAVTITGLSNPVYVGLVATSGSTTDLLRATFDNVTITPGTPNPPPQVSMRYPKAEATFNSGANIPLSAQAFDRASGTISQVEFRVGTTIIGTVTTPTPPFTDIYDLTWNNVVPGIYTVTARATDNGGAVTTSLAITIAVNPAEAITINPSHDAYVVDGTPTGNFGLANNMFARVGSGGNNFESYLKFDTTAASTVKNATLRVHGNSAVKQSLVVYAVAEPSPVPWTETTITWNEKPTTGDALNIASIEQEVRFHTLDVTEYVQTEKAAGRHVISLALKALTDVGVPITMDTAENQSGGTPELLITTNLYKGRVSTNGGKADRQKRYEEVARNGPHPDAVFNPPYNWLALNTERPSLFGRVNLKPASGMMVPRDARFVPDELLIQYENWVNEGQKERVRGRIGAAMKEKIKSPTRRALERGAEAGDLELVKLPRGQNVLEAIQLIRNQRGVKFAEPNLIYELQTNSDDTHFNSLWNMHGLTTPPPYTNPNGSKADDAWETGRTGSTTVYIGIIDDGVQVEHEDLRRNAWTNSLDLPGDGIDNDGNGFPDDTFGWDFANGDNTVFDGDRHGTNVTGIATAVGGNNLGVAGVTWRATFIPAKAFANDKAALSNLIKAIDYITDLKVRHGVNIVATNNSWGDPPVYSQALFDTIVRGANANILFIASAGNGGADGFGDDNDLVPHYPSSYDTTAAAGYDAVISVASIRNTSEMAVSSNYGRTSVDLAAPGQSVFTTWPSPTNYDHESGTSMAAPHVTGAAALYASMFRTATPWRIKEAILNSARATPTAAPNDKTVTGGMLNVGLLAAR